MTATPLLPGASQRTAFRDTQTLPLRKSRLSAVHGGDRGPRQWLDHYLRRDDTILARLLTRVSPGRGVDYTGSGIKRTVDLGVGFPLAVIALPIILALAAVSFFLEPDRAPFFVQSRVRSGRARLRIVKIRSMRHRGHGTSPEIRRFARFMRQHYLDELPQVFQVLAGDLSIVGIRVLPVDIYAALADTWSPERFHRWQTAYDSTKLGLTGVHQVFRGSGKDDSARFHRDLFYARRASLGLDLYLIWRTMLRSGR